MADNRRFYWLKLQEGFFTSKRIKKLRRLAGGDTFTIIYLKMQLLSLSKGGYLEYTGLESSFAEEIALDIDEDVENVQVTIQYLLSCGLLEVTNDKEYVMPYVIENTGSETKWAEKKRVQRQQKDAVRTIEGQCPREIDIEIDIDIDKKENIKRKSQAFVPPSVEMVREYCKKNNYSIDPESFVDFYSSKGWMVGKNKMKDWEAAVRTWQRSRKKEAGSVKETLDFSFKRS